MLSLLSCEGDSVTLESTDFLFFGEVVEVVVVAAVSEEEEGVDVVLADLVFADLVSRVQDVLSRA